MQNSLSPPEFPQEHASPFSPAIKIILGFIAAFILYVISRSSFPIFHTLVEVMSISITWSVFLLLWNARKYQENEAFLILGFALFLSGGIDLLHSVAYKGINAFASASPANLATQFWITGRMMETLGWLAFALLFHRKGLVPFCFAACLVLTALPLSGILLWKTFPVCFSDQTGLTTFKVGMEYAMVAIMVASLLLIRRKGQALDPLVRRYLLAALGLVALAELAFTLYSDVFGISNLAGHLIRIVSRYMLYLALIQMSVVKPHVLFFNQLHREKDRLAESEARWRTLSQNSPDHILDLDSDLKIRFANYPNPGLTMADLLGVSILDFLPPADKDRVRDILNKARSSKEPLHFETKVDTPSGKPIFYETTVVARESGNRDSGIRESGNELPPGLTLVARNITERKRRDQVFEARLRIGEFALTGSISDVLQKVLDEAELLTGSQIGFFHFVDEDQENLHLQNWSSRTLRDLCSAEGKGAHYPVSQAGVLRELVIPLVRKDKVVAVLGVGNREEPYDQTDVNMLNELADMAWDIVVRRKAELTLIETERQLAQALAHLPGMVFRCANDEHWTMAFASEGCRDLTGYDVIELIGNKEVTFTSLIHPEDREKVNDAVQKGLANRAPYEVVYRILPRNQGLKWVWEQGHGEFRDNQLAAIEGFIYDISDQIKAQEERRTLEKNVLETQKLESLGVLAGGIAHDFNNLLQAMLGFAELAEHQVGPDHPAQRSLHRVAEATKRAADLTQQMLAYSGRGQFTISQVDISEQVRAMSSLLEGSVSKSITFHRQLQDNLPKVSLDGSQFQQVVLNLLTNAAEAIGEREGNIHLRTGHLVCDVEYLAASTVSLDIATPAPAPGTFVFLEVQDDGCGMERETIAKIFEPFFTTKFVGRGLGLAATQGIIRGHQGALLIDSQPGVGTTMRVLFPADPSLEENVAEPHNVSGSPAKATQPLILVVEDEADLQDLIQTTLTLRGFQVIGAADGREAVKIFQSRFGEIAAVLLDMVMPHMGGEECLRRLKEIDPGVKVILMSGWAEVELQERFAGQKYAGLLTKPFGGGRLLELLQEILGKR